MIHDFFRERAYRRWDEPARHAHVELDLGCGKGQFLTELAERFPERLILGVDQLRGRLNKVERKARTRKLENVQLLCTTGWELVGYLLPDCCLDRVHILCPDPWPKARHAPRRLLNSEFLGRLATKLKPGGILHISTDDAPYWAFIHRSIEPLPHYQSAADGYADVADLKTDFEVLWESEGKTVRHAAFRVTPLA